ncbi:MAG: flagellar hook-basal body complex protein [Gemmatimonadetes bacterium]|nr:MAG: flagellar hook-basal body complex protein [Gemmatimonadota bacterium]
MGPGDAIRGALRYWERRQAALSNNLANAATDGFKGERVFGRLLEDMTLRAASRTDAQPGALAQTGRALDVALTGRGYLVVSTPDGLRYTRSGSLSVDDAGRLTDARGNPVLGDSGPIVLPRGAVEVTQDGAIRVDGEEVARFRIEVPGGGTRLERRDGLYFVPDGAGRRLPQDEIAMKGGHLEQSNVDPVGALVELLDIQRAYSATLRTAQVLDGVMETTARDLGRVR